MLILLFLGDIKIFWPILSFKCSSRFNWLIVDCNAYNILISRDAILSLSLYTEPYRTYIAHGFYKDDCYVCLRRLKKVNCVSRDVKQSNGHARRHEQYQGPSDRWRSHDIDQVPVCIRGLAYVC